MHRSSLLRMEYFIIEYILKCPTRKEKLKVLDVGSYDVNGTYRSLFDSDIFTYVGLDMTTGPNVDIVPCFPYNWDEIESNSFDIVVSGQAFEHIEFFWLTFMEMARVLSGSGLMAVVAPHGFGYHRYPVDCYRFYSDGLVALAKYTNMIPLHASTNMAPLGASVDWYSQQEDDSFLIAKKPLVFGADVIDKKTYKPSAVDMNKLLTGFVTIDKQNY